MHKRELLAGVAAPLLAMVVLLSLSPSAAAQQGRSGQPRGPETPNFNLEVVLRGEGFGLVRFRQPNDEAFIIHLGVWLRGLAPNTSYLLQRAVDTNVDDDCTSTAWLTLGRGPQPQSITTDETGAGRVHGDRDLRPLRGRRDHPYPRIAGLPHHHYRDALLGKGHALARRTLQGARPRRH